MIEKVLGIDVGGNSIGWTLLTRDPNTTDCEVLDCGIRVFTSAEEAGELKNRDRRAKRLVRRQLSRTADRREILSRLLVQARLLPEDERERRRLLIDGEDKDSYHLRTRALDERLEPYEIGRILMHLVRRRGFLSTRRQNLGELLRDPEVLKIVEELETQDIQGPPTKKKRKTKKETDQTASQTPKDDEEEEGTVLKAIKSLEGKMKEAGARTIGEYFFQLRQKGEPVRRRHTSRKMYEDEFEAIWEKQREYHPEILTDNLKENIHRILFFQRPLKLDPDRFGKCSYEPEEPRAYQALPSVQRWRIWQDLNKLAHKQKDSQDETPLTHQEKEHLFRTLEEKEKLTWAEVRKLLSLPKDRVFNLQEEKGKKGKELTGNTTSIRIRKALGEKWDNLNDERQDELTLLLIQERDRKKLYETLQKEWGFTREEAIKAISIPLKTGMASVSLKCVRNTLPHLQSSEWCPRKTLPDGSQHGCDREGHLWHHALELAGYDPLASSIPVEGVDKLPFPPEVRNPVVQKALYQLRKVVNAIIREYGKPDRIRIEFARDLRTSQRQRERINEEQKENEKKNKESREALINEFRITNPSKDDIIKHRLWKECFWKECSFCPYTGTPISMEMLFTDQVDIEHILPFSRSLDDSYMNKTLCIAEENRNVKHNKTPYEAYGHDAKRWEEITNRIKKLPKPKQDRFMTTELSDEFYNRQLNDTRHFAVSARKYLQHLGIHVEPTKGQATAMLREAWGLNQLLREIVNEELNTQQEPDQENIEDDTLNEETTSPDTEEEASSSRAGKSLKLRDDHRHHLIDSAVVALTSPALLKSLSEHSKRNDIPGKRAPYKGLPLPGKFRQQLKEKLKTVIVSYDPRHKIEGAFHDETAYGPRKEGEETTYVVRKLVSELSPNEIARIVDGGIRDRIIERIIQLAPEEKRTDVQTALKIYQEESKPKISKDIQDILKKLIKKLAPPGEHDSQDADQGVKDHTGKYIRRVRIKHRLQAPKTLPVKNARGEVYKVYFITGQYHHVEIFECTEDHSDPQDEKKRWKKGERRGYFVSQLESAERTRRLKQPLVKRTPPEEWGPHWKFVMSLHKNDMVELHKPKRKGIFRVESLEASINRVKLRLHTSANTKDNRTREFLQISQTGYATKINVDPLGRIRPAND